MRLRSRNSRSMERGIDTFKPNRERQCFSRAEASSAGRHQLNYALVRGGRVRKILTSVRTARVCSSLRRSIIEVLPAQNGKTRSKAGGGITTNVQFRPPSP